jgi:N-acetylated-alpha-linked acidic dipeptidase
MRTDDPLGITGPRVAAGLIVFARAAVAQAFRACEKIDWRRLVAQAFRPASAPPGSPKGLRYRGFFHRPFRPAVSRRPEGSVKNPHSNGFPSCPLCPLWLIDAAKRLFLTGPDGLRYGSVVGVLVLGVVGSGWISEQAGRPIYGFTTRSAAQQRSLENRFLLLPSPDKARATHAFLTAEPHVAGTPRDRVLAEWIRDRWREYGLGQVEIVEHEVLLPYPLEVQIGMTRPLATDSAADTWRASTREDPVAGDPFSARDIGPAYHAYSASGDITAPVVYAGSGNPSDYAWLAEHGIDIKGKIALVRYSVPYSYRGFKALTAEERGAAGILIYSDPADDGFKKGKTYPDGPWGPDSHIQRGGIVYDFRVPGDPLTPGWPSLPGARRIAAAAAMSLPKIISAPLSWRDARVLLEAMRGPEAPGPWQGGLPMTYRVGPTPAAVHMRVRMDDAVRAIWTVTARLTGATHPDQLVIVGNHRDAWAYGGVDPSSGTASMMELARSLGVLAKQGLRPKRTIVFASWDAEEFTLTSSTEWGEQHASELAGHAVAYLNVDNSVSGVSFGASAVPSLNRAIAEAADAVIDPDSGRSIAAASQRSTRDASALPGATGNALVNNRLGSGSDYTVFLNFLGVPVLDMSFTGPYGVYHSIYDNHLWMSKFGDPGFRYHAAMARIWGVLALRLANADVVPLDYRPYADRIREFIGDVTDHAAPRDRVALGPLGLAATRFAEAARGMSGRIDALLSSRIADPASALAIDRALLAAEGAFIDRDGLPGRPWYRHLIYAPKPTYAPEVLPGVAEAAQAGDRARLADQVRRLVAALDRATQTLR